MLTECLDDSPEPGKPARDRGDPVDARRRCTLAAGRSGDGARSRRRGPRHLSRTRRSGRRGDRIAQSRRDFGAAGRSRQRPGALRAMPGDCPQHRAPGTGKRMRAQSGRDRARGRKPAGRANAVRAFAQGLPGRGRQAGRSDRLWRLGKTDAAAGDSSPRASRLSEALRGFAGIRNERGGAGLPRGLCRSSCSRSAKSKPPFAHMRPPPRSARRASSCDRRTAKGKCRRSIEAARAALGEPAFEVGVVDGADVDARRSRSSTRLASTTSSAVPA